MPYISAEHARELQEHPDKATTPGDWNYLFSVAIIKEWNKAPCYATWHDLNYALRNFTKPFVEIARVDKVLHDQGVWATVRHCALREALREFHRRVIVPYEDAKRNDLRNVDPYEQVEGNNYLKSYGRELHKVEQELTPDTKPTCKQSDLSGFEYCEKTTYSDKLSPPPTNNSEGLRLDEGKARWDLLPYDGLEEVVKVLMFGSRKYGDDNWTKGISYRRTFSCVLRHMWKWFMSKVYGTSGLDEESGLSHLAHACTDVLMLVTYEKRGMDKFDDRPCRVMGGK